MKVAIQWNEKNFQLSLWLCFHSENRTITFTDPFRNTAFGSLCPKNWGCLALTFGIFQVEVTTKKNIHESVYALVYVRYEIWKKIVLYALVSISTMKKRRLFKTFFLLIWHFFNKPVFVQMKRLKLNLFEEVAYPENQGLNKTLFTTSFLC